MFKSGKSKTFFLFSSFFLNLVANMAANLNMHKIENKSLWKEEMSYGGDTWCRVRIFEELRNYVCVWLISICIINKGPN